MQGREVWTKGLPLLSSRPPPLPSPSSPRLIIHSRHGEPRESRSLPPLFFFFFFYWMASREKLSRRCDERGWYWFFQEACLFSSTAAVLSPSPPPPPSFLRQIASFRLTSFRGTRIASTSSSHDDCLPRYLFFSLSLLDSWLPAQSYSWLLFLPKNCTSRESPWFREVRRASFWSLSSVFLVDINRIISEEKGWGGTCFRCCKLIRVYIPTICTILVLKRWGIVVKLRSRYFPFYKHRRKFVTSFVSHGIRFLPCSWSSPPLGDTVFDSPYGETGRNGFACLHGWNRKRFGTDEDGERRGWIGIRWYFGENCSRSVAGSFSFIVTAPKQWAGSLQSKLWIVSRTSCNFIASRRMFGAIFETAPVTPSSSPPVMFQYNVPREIDTIPFRIKFE